jgi:RNA-splicing ligase RtcB
MPILTTVKQPNGAPVKVWTRDIEASAMTQLENMATLPFIHKHIAVMPDVHWGMGSTVGSVIPTIKAIVPAAVGVDIGCGMAASKLCIRPDQLPDNLSGIRSAIEAAIPHGPKRSGRDCGRAAASSLREGLGVAETSSHGYSAILNGRSPPNEAREHHDSILDEPGNPRPKEAASQGCQNLRDASLAYSQGPAPDHAGTRTALSAR